MKTNKNGKEMYYKGNKLVAKKDIPENVMILDKDFESDVEIIDDRPSNTVTLNAAVEIPLSERVCAICGEPREAQRFINLKTVDLCQQHYAGMTLGEVVQALKEKANG